MKEEDVRIYLDACRELLICAQKIQRERLGGWMQDAWRDDVIGVIERELVFTQKLLETVGETGCQGQRESGPDDRGADEWEEEDGRAGKVCWVRWANSIACAPEVEEAARRKGRRPDWLVGDGRKDAGRV